jgi:hypothetical protein
LWQKPHLGTEFDNINRHSTEKEVCGLVTKQAKQLEIQRRYVYNSEIEICPQCKEPLQPQAYYQWQKTVQQLTGAIHIAHRAVIDRANMYQA